MHYVADDVQIVGSDEFVTKDGEVRYSLMFADGNGSPHKVSCMEEHYKKAVPMRQLYTIVINADTVGYNTYCDLVELIEK